MMGTFGVGQGPGIGEVNANLAEKVLLDIQVAIESRRKLDHGDRTKNQTISP